MSYPYLFSLLSRCMVGDDWWYYGDRCQYRDTTQNKIIVAVVPCVCALAVMLVITAVSVTCVKKKYKRLDKLDSIVMPNMVAT